MKSFWRWTGTVFFALVFVVLVVTGIGTSLPIDHHVSCSATFQKPSRFLFAAVENEDTSVYWRPEIASAVLVSGNGATAIWRETDTQGRAITYRTIAYSEGNRLARTVDFVPGVQFGGTWTFEFSPGGISVGHGSTGKTRVTIIEDGQIYNPIFRFLARFVFGYTQTMHTYLQDLAKLATENPDVTCAANP